MKTLKRSRGLRSQRGFTLIELLVVVLIVGILAAIALPQYFKVVERATASEIVQDTGDIWNAEQRYSAQKGQYSANFSDLDSQYYNSDGTLATASTLKLKNYTVTLGGGGGNALTVDWVRQGNPPSAYGAAYDLTYTCSKNGVPCALAETKCATSNQCSALVQ